MISSFHQVLIMLPPGSIARDRISKVLELLVLVVQRVRAPAQGPDEF